MFRRRDQDPEEDERRPRRRPDKSFATRAAWGVIFAGMGLLAVRASVATVVKIHGDGMATAALTGSENADEIFMEPDGPVYSSNHAGGILGGISTGQEIVVRFAVKPTSSILTTRKTITKSGEETEIITKGRHDPCVGIRAVPVGEAMMACVLLDHILMHRGQIGGAVGDTLGRIG